MKKILKIFLVLLILSNSILLTFNSVNAFTCGVFSYCESPFANLNCRLCFACPGGGNVNCDCYVTPKEACMCLGWCPGTVFVTWDSDRCPLGGGPGF